MYSVVFQLMSDIFTSINLCHPYASHGARFVTSDVQFINHKNISSEGIDSR